MRPVEPVDDLVVVRVEEWWEAVGVCAVSGRRGLGKLPGVSNDVDMVEVVTGSWRALLAASKIEYPRVRSPWTKRRTSTIRDSGKLFD